MHYGIKWIRSSIAKEGIIEPVEFADWVAPFVSVLKGNGDFKLTVYRALRRDTYPLSRIEDL